MLGYIFIYTTKVGEMRHLTQALSKITNPMCQQQGFIRSAIILDWKLIIGDKFAELCHPVRIHFPFEKRTGGRLYLKTSSSFAPEIAHLEPMIVDKINAYFGYGAVEKITIAHGFIKPPVRKKKIKYQLNTEQRSMLEESVRDVTNNDLKEALFNLGVGIMEEAAQRDLKNDISNGKEENEMNRAYKLF